MVKGIAELVYFTLIASQGCGAKRSNPDEAISALDVEIASLDSLGPNKASAGRFV